MSGENSKKLKAEMHYRLDEVGDETALHMLEEAAAIYSTAKNTGRVK